MNIPKENIEEFARRLNYYMNLINIDRKELTELSGLYRSDVGYYIRGERMPTRDKARKIANVLEQPENIFDDLYEVGYLEDEIWQPLSDFPEYEGSNRGRIRNPNTAKIMKTNINERGYSCIQLRKNGKPHDLRVHRVIAETFLDGCGHGLDVNHEDGNKLNNNPDNFTWVTRSENILHAYRTGLKSDPRKIKVRVIETGEVFDSLNECANSIGCSRGDISKCLRGILGQVNGYHFERV